MDGLFLGPVVGGKVPSAGSLRDTYGLRGLWKAVFTMSHRMLGVGLTSGIHG